MAELVLTTVGESSRYLSLIFVGDRRMRSLNKRFRDRDKTTDVLAFATCDARIPAGGSTKSSSLGDVVISFPAAMRQARDHHRRPDEEIVSLLVHGILHLCGYDHERNQSEARRMRRRERMILAQLGRVPGLIGPLKR